MDKIFIDSNFFVALYNSEDSLYERALAISRSLEKDPPRAFISNYIFLETVTVLSQRASRKEAIIRGNQLLDKNNFQIIQITDSLQTSAWEVFCETKKKNTSFVDCSTVAVMQAEGIDKLLTFDTKDFKSLLKKHHLKLF